ncbi:MAG: DegT/DnrJ/EryC1/StrS family aminotransferase [Cyclobacteriaceae bacterium]
MINVTKPFMPPVSEYEEYLKGIWKRNWLTNNGPLVNEFELKLKEYLNVPHLLYLSNGTIAIQIAIKALELKGEVITTPFSYVATTSSIVWEGCTPVFVDIDPETLNIDPNKIEASITEKTSAVLATHVYGNPCDIDSIEAVAKRNNLKVIYDAAHCFGSKYKNRSVFEYGDVSTTSFHATKLFHTIEGGAVFTKSPELLKRMASMRNFGHNGPEDFDEVGINGKNSEFHAAMGLTNFPYIDKILKSRKEKGLWYDEALLGLNVKKIKYNPLSEVNHSYYPIIFQDEQSLLKAFNLLSAHNIGSRRYFFPSLNNVPYVPFQKVPISDEVSRRVLCLPLFYDLGKEEVKLVSRLLLRAQNN